jgi:hypothetical protein
MKQRWMLCLLGLFAFLNLQSQSKVSFTAETDALRIVPNQPFTVSFTLKNAEGQNFEEPNFDPLQLIRGPSIANSLQIINGKRSNSTTYSFVLHAPQTGTFNVKPASIQVDGQRLKSNTLSIQVVPPSRSGDRDNRPTAFIELELSTDSPYVGQVVRMDVVLYSQQAIQNAYKVNDLDREGWYSLTLPGQGKVQRTTFEGEPYRRQVLSTELLYALQSGPHTFGPLFLKVDLEDESSKRRSPFSLFRSFDRKELATEPANVEVQALPTPSPVNFSGLVGPVHLQGRVETQRVETGNAAEFSLRMESFSDPNIVKPPELAVEGAEVLQPQLTAETSEDIDGSRMYVHVYKYLLIPDTLGKLSFSPYTTTFNIQSQRYDTIRGDTYELWAEPPRETPASSEDALAVEEQSSTGKENSLAFWFFSIASVAVLAFLFVRFYLRRQRDEQKGQSSTLEAEFSSLLNENEPDPKKLRKCIQELLEKDDTSGMDRERWKKWLDQLDYSMYSPNAGREEWKQLLSSWREYWSQRK